MDGEVQYGEHDEDSIIPAVAVFVAGAKRWMESTNSGRRKIAEHSAAAVAFGVARWKIAAFVVASGAKQRWI